MAANFTRPTSYRLLGNNKSGDSLHSDASGRLTFDCEFSDAATQDFTLKPKSLAQELSLDKINTAKPAR